MISSDNRRYAYGKSQLIEVICQLRFPTILSIDTREPADFQETVRAAFPRYQCQVEKLPGVNGAPAMAAMGWAGWPPTCARSTRA